MEQDHVLDRIDSNSGIDILTAEEVARYLKKSLSWVYKHWQILGGVKLGGSILFPSREELYERIFGKRQGVEVRLHPEGDQAHGSLVQDQKRRKGGRGKKKGGDEESKGNGSQSGAGDDPDRYGLFGLSQ